MERTGTGNVATAASTGSALPYRRHIVGLPLQCSVFRLTPHAATKIGLPGLTTELDFPAMLEDNGNLFLDRSKVAALAKVLASSFTPETLERMHTTHATACATLIDASEAVARVTACDDATVTKFADDLANKMALVLAYGILSKFVPDILLRTLADAGDVETPPFPERSAGAELMRETFVLYQACCALDYSPQRLQQEWPRVSPKVLQLFRDFRRRQTGFGPLAWDSPGYEDASFVIRLLHSAFDQIDAEQIRRRLALATRPAGSRSTTDVSPKTAALRRALGFWLEFLERETWYVRRAFYVGMLPLLRKLTSMCLQKLSGLELTDLLFLEISELTTGPVDPAVIRTRRDRYMANTEYLCLRGVGPSRLATMVESS